MRDGTKNLIPFSQRSEEEVKKMRSKGGKKSVETRRARKTFREGLKLLLSGHLEKGTPNYMNAKKTMQSLGLSGEPTAQNLLELGLFKKAMKGDPFAFATIRDTLGEKPTETFEDVTPKSPIILGVIPAEKVKKAKEDHEIRQNKED